MIETWRAGAIVTGAVTDEAGAAADGAEAALGVDPALDADALEADALEADALEADALEADAALGDAWTVEAMKAAAATESRGSSRAVGRSNIRSSVRGVSQRVKRSLFFLETSAWIPGERADGDTRSGRRCNRSARDDAIVQLAMTRSFSSR
jgi:hypothetical protein